MSDQHQETLISTEDEDGLELDLLRSGLEGLSEQPVAEQVAVLEDTHDLLREKLN